MEDSYELIDGKEVRTILQARLLEVSIVLSEPAYANTLVYTRSLSSALEGKETLSEDEQKAALAEIEKLQSLLPKVEEEPKQEEVIVEEEKDPEPEGPTEEELKAQEEAAAKEAEEMQKLYDRLEAASKILCGESA